MTMTAECAHSHSSKARVFFAGSTATRPRYTRKMLPVEKLERVRLFQSGDRIQALFKDKLLDADHLMILGMLHRATTDYSFEGITVKRREFMNGFVAPESDEKPLTLSYTKSERTFQRKLAALAELGLITVARNGRGKDGDSPCTYSINYDVLGEAKMGTMEPKNPKPRRASGLAVSAKKVECSDPVEVEGGCQVIQLFPEKAVATPVDAKAGPVDAKKSATASVEVSVAHNRAALSKKTGPGEYETIASVGVRAEATWKAAYGEMYPNDIYTPWRVFDRTNIGRLFNQMGPTQQELLFQALDMAPREWRAIRGQRFKNRGPETPTIGWFVKCVDTYLDVVKNDVLNARLEGRKLTRDEQLWMARLSSEQRAAVIAKENAVRESSRVTDEATQEQRAILIQAKADREAAERARDEAARLAAPSIIERLKNNSRREGKSLPDFDPSTIKPIAFPSMEKKDA